MIDFTDNSMLYLLSIYFAVGCETVKKKISIIVPVYNVEKYLPMCVDSLIAQTYESLEIILADDGSIDGSGAICDSYAKKDDRIKVIHKENGGQCSARNRGIDIATGELLMFVDSDDYVDVSICKKLYDVMQDTGAAVVRCGFLNYSEYGNLKGRSNEANGEVSVFTTEQAFRNFVCAPYSCRKPFIPMVCAALYDRKLFDSVKFPEGKIYEEGFVLPKVFLQCDKLAFLDEQLYFYFINISGTMASGLSERGLKSLDDWKEIHFLISDRFPSLLEATAKRWIDKYIRTYSALRNQKDILTAEEVMDCIVREMKAQEQYFISFAGKELKNKVKAFNSGYDKYEKYIRRCGYIETVKAKLHIR